MTPEEQLRIQQKLGALEDLRMYANNHKLSFEEGKFLNVFGKCAEEMRFLWDMMYRPTKIDKDGHLTAVNITERTVIKANRAAGAFLCRISEVLGESNDSKKE